MLGIDWETVRLFLHVLAATIWVGGQLVLGAAVPALRRQDAEAPGVVARSYAAIAWPAFAVLIATGVWNIVAVGHQPASWQHALQLKLAFVAISGVGAFIHQRANSKLWLALGGAMAGLGALVALLYGVRLAQ